MALSELSAGHIGRNRHVMETPPDSDTSDTGKQVAYFKAKGNGARAVPLPTPSSVQSMLRNGTEIGDVGELAFKPNRRASPAHRMPSSRSSSSVLPSARNKSNTNRREKYPQPDEHGILPGITRFHDPSGSNGIPNAAFIYRNRSPLSSGTQSRAPSSGPESANERSYALMHSSFTSRGTPQHPTHINGHLRSQGDPRGMRPRSPLAYPTRLKRPGYRPSSPALTEVYRSGSRSPYGLARATSFRTASPLSTYGVGQSPSHWPQVASRSGLLLASDQISPIARDYNDQHLGEISHQRLGRSRNYAPGPTSVQTEVLDRPASPAQHQSATPFPPPLFYDYSEQFQQHADDRPPLAKGVDQGRLRAVEEHILGHYKSSKTAAAHDVASTNPKMLRSRTTGSASLGQADVVPSEVALEGINHGDTSLSAKDSLDIQVDGNVAGPSAIGKGTVLGESVSALGNKEYPEITPQTSSGQGQTAPGQHTFSSFGQEKGKLESKPNRTVNNPKYLAYHGRKPSASSDDSVNSVVSSVSKRRSSQPRVAGFSSTPLTRHTRHDLLVPEADAPRFSYESERAYVKRLSDQNCVPTPSDFAGHASLTISACGRPQTQLGQIHSPIPRRSLSSPSNRERFSSILSIDEDVDELNEVATVSKGVARLDPSEASDYTKHSTHKSINTGASSPIVTSFPNLSKLNGIVERNAATSDTDDDAGLVKGSRANSSPLHERQAQDNLVDLQRRNLHENETGMTAREAKTRESYSSQDHSGFQNQSLTPVQLSPASLSNVAHGAHDLVALPSDPSVPRTMKDLPPLPRSSVVSVAPPQDHNASPLPFSFTALRTEETREDESVTELGYIAASYLDHLDRLGTETQTKPAKYKFKAGSDKGSPPPRPSSRPWNSETNYPWNDQTPQFELAAPKLATVPNGPMPATAPRFKLKLHRSSVSTTGTAKIRKRRPSDEVEVRKQSSTASASKQQRFALGIVPPVRKEISTESLGHWPS